jgi:hypothetical protein
MGYRARVEFALFQKILQALAAARFDYILVGGVAVNLHGVVRATEDIDLFVRLDHGNVERLKAALKAVWDDPELDTFTAADLEGDYPTLRYAPPNTELVVDILTRIGTQFAFDDLEFEVIDVEGTPARVATIRSLIEMKRATLRAIDRADVEALTTRLPREE